MPDTSPTSAMLRRLGINIPDNKGPVIDKATQNRVAKESQSKMPIWKQYAQSGIDALVGGLKGVLGVDPAEGESYAGRKTNLGIQALTAGLPFATLRKGKPIFHGTKKVFEKFNPSLYDESDVLGWMTHGAVDPSYAESYALGQAKHGLDWSDKPNIIAMQPEAKNVLDLYEPNVDDLSQAIASTDPRNRANLIDLFKWARRNPEDAREFLKLPQGVEANQLSVSEIPARFVAEKIRLSPEEFEKTPFDAIRYRDVRQESYAIPPKTPITSYYGKAPLTDAPRELKVVKDVGDRPYTGTAEVAEDRWKYTPLSLTDTPIAEQHKEISNLQKHMQETLGKIPTSKSKSFGFGNQKFTPKEWEDLDKFEKLYGKIKGAEQNPSYALAVAEDADLHAINPSDYGSIADLEIALYGKPEPKSKFKISYPDEPKSSGPIKIPGPSILSDPSKQFAYHPTFGHIDKKEASALVNGGELPMSWYMKNFPE